MLVAVTGVWRTEIGPGVARRPARLFLTTAADSRPPLANWWRAAGPLELILQRELHDARVARSSDAAELHVVAGGTGLFSWNQLSALNDSIRASSRCVLANRNERTIDRSKKC